MQRNWTRAVVAGVVGTLVMTAVGVWLAPMMGIPRMNPAEMLAGPAADVVTSGPRRFVVTVWPTRSAAGRVEHIPKHATSAKGLSERAC